MEAGVCCGNGPQYGLWKTVEEEKVTFIIFQVGAYFDGNFSTNLQSNFRQWLYSENIFRQKKNCLIDNG